MKFTLGKNTKFTLQVNAKFTLGKNAKFALGVFKPIYAVGNRKAGLKFTHRSF